jgi:hypothetical protein
MRQYVAQLVWSDDGAPGDAVTLSLTVSSLEDGDQVACFVRHLVVEDPPALLSVAAKWQVEDWLDQLGSQLRLDL